MDEKDKQIKEFLEKLFDLYDQAPLEISFNAACHNVKRVHLPERIKFSKPHGNNRTISYDAGNPDRDSFDITLFMKKEE